MKRMKSWMQYAEAIMIGGALLLAGIAFLVYAASHVPLAE